MDRAVLALDLGAKRTGVALLSPGTDVPVMLPTLTHESLAELAPQLQRLLAERNVATLVVGLPLLLSGEEGEQAVTVRQWVAEFQLPPDVQIFYIDERFTTPRGPQTSNDAEAALTVLQTWLERHNKALGK